LVNLIDFRIVGAHFKLGQGHERRKDHEKEREGREEFNDGSESVLIVSKLRPIPSSHGVTTTKDAMNVAKQIGVWNQLILP
jgi:hypothetical protein